MRRVPRPKRRPHPFVLTERDREILDALHHNRVLTAELVEWAFFPPAAGKPRSSRSSCAYDRVARLFEAGYLGKLDLPAPLGGGSHPQVLVLDRLGVPVVGERLGIASDEVHRLATPGKVGEQFLRHGLAISHAWGALSAAARNSEYALQRWVGEAELRASYDHVRDPAAPQRRPIPVLPDAYFVLRRGDGLVRSYFLEIDLGTHVLERFRRKLRGLELYRADGFRRRFGAETFSVLVVAETTGRLAGLLRAARTVVSPENRGRYLLGTAELLRPERVLAGPWARLDGERGGLP